MTLAELPTTDLMRCVCVCVDYNAALANSACHHVNHQPNWQVFTLEADVSVSEALL